MDVSCRFGPCIMRTMMGQSCPLFSQLLFTTFLPHYLALGTPS